MPIIRTSGWQIKPVPESAFVQVDKVIRLPVFVRPFMAPHEGYAIVYPQGKLDSTLWGLWLKCCQRNALFDPEHKFWVWSSLSLGKLSLPNEASAPADSKYALTKEERAAAKLTRDAEQKTFEERLQELSKHENVPADLWSSYVFPSHHIPPSHCPAPTALQRIIVSRYWDRPAALIGASVGTGKSRVVVDILSARMKCPGNEPMNNTARIVLVVAPLALHENWRREFDKWSDPELRWCCHKFKPTKDFWNAVEADAVRLFDGPSGLVPGGLVLITTPHSLSRSTLYKQFSDREYIPTCVVVDEAQKFFRKPDNKAYHTLQKFRSKAGAYIALSGTPTSKLEDWWAHEEILHPATPGTHWRDARYLDYQRLGDKVEFYQSGLHQKGWNFEHGIKQYHAFRIAKGDIFMADKGYYLKDALPGLDQEELGEYADLRLGFEELCERYPDWVKSAWDLQVKENPSTFKGNAAVMATTLMLRMRQLAATSMDTKALLKQFVEDFLDDGEPCVFWVEFRNKPCEQLQETVDFLNQYGPTAYVMGGMPDDQRQEGIDGFQSGKYRFQVLQMDAGGVGITLTKACKNLFLTVPLGYQAVTQCIGRLHRLGQTSDVISYFAMTSPIACFARGIYDRRAELNEVIPQKISGIFKEVVDAQPAAA